MGVVPTSHLPLYLPPPPFFPPSLSPSLPSHLLSNYPTGIDQAVLILENQMSVPLRHSQKSDNCYMVKCVYNVWCMVIIASDRRG